MFEKLKGMFGEHGDGGGIAILSPIEGELLAIGAVNDPAFADELVGKGVAVRPTGGRVVSPIDGTVSFMFETGHAVALSSDDGVEILIHVGLDTVNLAGRHFTVHVSSGDSVAKGTLLMEFDREAIEADGYDSITPVVIANPDDFKTVDRQPDGAVRELDLIMTLHR